MTGTTPAPKPLLVMVTGEPGSGKTSLGRQLAEALRVPFLSRDHVRGGLLAASGLWTNQLHDPPPREQAVEAFTELIETAARLRITTVAEFVVTPQRLEAFRRLRAAADTIVILTTSSAAATRAERRDRADPLLNRRDVLDALGHGSIDEYLRGPERDRIRTTMQRDFDDLPLLHVATDEGYDPSLEAIVDWVIGRTRR